MRKDELTTAELLLEAVGIVSGLLYLGLQIYYGMIYRVNLFSLFMNLAGMVLVYAGLTLLSLYPERVNGLTKEICSGDIRRYTVHMVRAAKLIFTFSLLFTSICDVMGHQLNTGYSVIVVLLIVAVTIWYEVKIIKILRNQKKD